jgi:hypothetical protein
VGHKAFRGTWAATIQTGSQSFHTRKLTFSSKLKVYGPRNEIHRVTKLFLRLHSSLFWMLLVQFLIFSNCRSFIRVSLSSHLCLRLPLVPVPSGFHLKFCLTSLSLSILYTCPNHLNLCDLIKLIIFLLQNF